MTLSQKQIVKQRSKIDAVRYTALLNWYIKELGHPGYETFAPSKEYPQPEFLVNRDTPNNTDDLGNPEKDNVVMNGTFDFSAAQDLSCTTSLYGSKEQFSMNLIQQEQPILLACGGNYADLKNVGLEKFLVGIFPFGVSRPTMKR